MISSLSRRLVYLDANVFIYALENHVTFGPTAKDVLTAVCRPPSIGHTSELTLTEVLVMPMRLARADAISLYKAVLTDRTKVALKPIDRSVLLQAARLRADHGLRLPDSIHLATAQSSGCDVFITEDRRIRPIGSIEVLNLSTLSTV